MQTNRRCIWMTPSEHVYLLWEEVWPRFDSTQDKGQAYWTPSQLDQKSISK